MKVLKKLFIGFLICSVFNLFVTPFVYATLQYEETDKSGYSFKNWAADEYDLSSPEKKEDKSWFSKNKWWVLLGVVTVGVGAAAAGGGGGGSDDETKTGSADVSW